MITPADIEYKEFTKVVRGYKEEEVDEFLDLIIVDMENPEAIKKAVASGMGISIISKLAAAEEVEKGNLLALPVDSENSKRDINVVYDLNLQPSRTTERFIKVIKEMYK